MIKHLILAVSADVLRFLGVLGPKAAALAYVLDCWKTPTALFGAVRMRRVLCYFAFSLLSLRHFKTGKEAICLLFSQIISPRLHPHIHERCLMTEYINAYFVVGWLHWQIKSKKSTEAHNFLLLRRHLLRHTHCEHCH